MIQLWVLRIHEYLAIFKLESLGRLLIKNDVEWNLFLFLRCLEVTVRLHLGPSGSMDWVVLHGLAQELETLESDLDVLGPSPGALLDLTIEQL